jgi:hypothetical protein
MNKKRTVKAEEGALVDAPGWFVFVSSPGADAEVMRFRNGQGEAVLNLHEAKTPTLNVIQALFFQGSMELWDDNVPMANKRPSLQSYMSDGDYQVGDVSDPLHPNYGMEINQVLEKITNYKTGTAFLLTAGALSLVRRPPVDEEFRIRERQMSRTP